MAGISSEICDRKYNKIHNRFYQKADGYLAINDIDSINFMLREIIVDDHPLDDLYTFMRYLVDVCGATELREVVIDYPTEYRFVKFFHEKGLSDFTLFTSSWKTNLKTAVYMINHSMVPYVYLLSSLSVTSRHFKRYLQGGAIKILDYMMTDPKKISILLDCNPNDVFKHDIIRPFIEQQQEIKSFASRVLIADVAEIVIQYVNFDFTPSCSEQMLDTLQKEIDCVEKEIEAELMESSRIFHAMYANAYDNDYNSAASRNSRDAYGY
jgi:hypothetical protein